MAASLNSPLSHEIDLEAEIADRRYAAALAQVTVYDVLSIFNEMVSECEPREHPCYRLAAHVLRHGAAHRSGRHYHATDYLTAQLEKWLDEAVERCVVDILHSDQLADMAMEME